MSPLYDTVSKEDNKIDVSAESRILQVADDPIPGHICLVITFPREFSGCDSGTEGLEDLEASLVFCV